MEQLERVSCRSNSRPTLTHGPPVYLLPTFFLQSNTCLHLSLHDYPKSDLTSLPPLSVDNPYPPTPQPHTYSSTALSHDKRQPTTTMSRHHPDLVMCRKQPGISIGRLCDKCDGKCPVCDSYVRPTTLVRICDECSFGNYQNKCIVCGGEGISDAFYCFECTRLEKDRDGCPKIINLGSSRTDLFYQKKSFRNH